MPPYETVSTDASLTYDLAPLDVATWGPEIIGDDTLIFAGESGSVWTEDAERIDELFARLTDEWLDDIAYTSSLGRIIRSRPYQDIIEMGPIMVPFILADLQTSPKHWFHALQEITGADPDPIPDNAAGNMRLMTAAWLAWGRDKGHLT